MTESKTRWIYVGLVCFVSFAVIGFWWWQWQAPYRVLRNFLKALQHGDIETLYALSLDKEKELGLTKEIVSRIYHYCLKPVFDRHHMIKIERQDRHILIRKASVSFLLWFEGLNRPIVIGVTRWPGTCNWRISFSAFAMSVTRYFMVRDNYQRYKFFKNLGLKFCISPNGAVEDLEILILQEYLWRRSF